MAQHDLAWSRLQRRLLLTEPDDIVTVSSLASETGVSSESVGIVLAALTRAELFELTEQGDYVRRRLMAPIGTHT
jgi:hypothetical protein